MGVLALAWKMDMSVIRGQVRNKQEYPRYPQGSRQPLKLLSFLRSPSKCCLDVLYLSLFFMYYLLFYLEQKDPWSPQNDLFSWSSCPSLACRAYLVFSPPSRETKPQPRGIIWNSWSSWTLLTVRFFLSSSKAAKERTQGTCWWPPSIIQI